MMLPLVDSADFDASLGFLHRYQTLHGLERHETRPAADRDVAVRRFDGDVAADAFRRHVGVGAVHTDAHPGRHRDHVIERARRPAARGPRPDGHGLIDQLDVHGLAIRVVDFDADGILAPRLDVHVAGEVIHAQLRAFRHVHRLIRGRDRHHGDNEFCNHR
jgi:hypothetical protein